MLDAISQWNEKISHTFWPTKLQAKIIPVKSTKLCFIDQNVTLKT